MAYLAFLKFIALLFAYSLAAISCCSRKWCPQVSLKNAPYIWTIWTLFHIIKWGGPADEHLACHLMLVLHFPDVAILILTGALKPRLIIVEPFVFLLWAQSTFPTTPFAHWQSHPSLCPLAHNTTFIARVSTSYPSHIIHKSSSSYSNCCNKKKDRSCSSALIKNQSTIKKHHYGKNWKFLGLNMSTDMVNIFV